MDRRAFLALFSAGCGDVASYPSSPNRFPGSRNAYPVTPKVYPVTPVGYPSTISYDLRTLSDADKLVGYWDVPTANITMSATPIASGTATIPTVSFSGPGLSNASGRGLTVSVEPEDATKFRWNFRNLWGSQRNTDYPPGERNVAIPVGGTYDVGSGSSLITISFGAGTYRTDHLWQATAQSIVGQVGGTLDNSSVVASKGHIIMGPQAFNNYCPSLRVTPFYNTGPMGQVGGIDTIFTGTNKPFHFFFVKQTTQTNISTLSVSEYSFSHLTTTTSQFLDSRMYGPLGTAGPEGVGPQYFINRQAPTGGAQRKGFLTDLGFEPMVHEFCYDGSVVSGYICGLPMFENVAWTSPALTLQRFMIGGLKPGTGAVAQVPYLDWVTFAAYNQKLSADSALQKRKALMGYPP